jgi:hypothetical protein
VISDAQAWAAHGYFHYDAGAFTAPALDVDGATKGLGSFLDAFEPEMTFVHLPDVKAGVRQTTAP